MSLSTGSNGIVAEIVVGIVVLGFLGLLVLSFANVDDGLDEWRDSKGVHLTEVIYQGKKYYCDDVEMFAGQPHRLRLHRGKISLLALPEKISVMNLPKDE